MNNLLIVSTCIIFLMVSCDNQQLDNKVSDFECVTWSCAQTEEYYSYLNNFFSPDNIQILGTEEYISSLKGIDCATISIDPDCVPTSWLKELDLEYLLAQLKNNAACVKIKTPFEMVRSDVIDLEKVKTKQSTVSVESLHLLNAHIIGHYPCNNKFNIFQISDTLRLMGKLAN